jgi:two-component system sensor histidine kinase TtrS
MIRRIALFIIILFGLSAIQLRAQDATSVARIGVLAYRGSDRLDQQWAAQNAYLNAAIPGWKFELVPVTLVSATERLEAGELMFLVTNPGHFVELDERFSLSVLASRLKRLSDGSLAGEFGGAIIVPANSDIHSLSDVTDRHVLAVDPDAFGGFQLAWRTFERAGVDLFTDPAKLEFTGFPMDQIVRRITAGEADVGLVRSGLVEAMIAEGKIPPDSVRFLNRNASYRHGEGVSTRLYPEWPFAALSSTPRELRDKVALALLSAHHSDLPEAGNLRDYWSAPYSYDAVRELRAAYTARLERAEARPVRLLLFAAAGLFLVATLLGLVILRRRRPALIPIQGTPDETPITPREREVLDLIAAGNSSKEIARILGISPKTVEYHRANLLRKYEARTSSQLIAKAT